MNNIEDVQTPLGAFCYWEHNTPNSIFLSQPIAGASRLWTYREAGIEVRKLAGAISRFNLPAGSNIAILSKNCAEWILADLAIWMAGHVSVPIYPTTLASSLRKILTHSASKILFIGKLDSFEDQVAGVPEEVTCISIDPYNIDFGMRWSDIIKTCEPIKEVSNRAVAELATIKYTSGTTGAPKGVMVSFEALHHATTTAFKAFNLPKGGVRFFSYLPLSHVAERMLIEMGCIYTGGTIFFSESLDKFPENLCLAEPTVFVAVPRIWAKFREQIEKKISYINLLLKIPIVRTIVCNVIKKRLGLSKCLWIFSGAAPITVEMLEWFARLRIVIHEVYGMTENISYSHINLKDIKFGTVGKPWRDVLVKFSDRGEIQLKHQALFMGYFREPELTNEAFTPDGYLKTGDLGKLDDEGFLIITGRLKDQFKTAKGKFVDPSHIEHLFLSNASIEQICVVGSGLVQPIALVVLCEVAKKVQRDVISKHISYTLSAVNSKVESHERVKCVVILKNEWTIENGLVTPTLKIKRNELEKLYSCRYNEWYHQNVVNWE